MPRRRGQGADGSTAGAADKRAGHKPAAGNGSDGSTTGRTDGTTRKGSLLLLSHVIASSHRHADDESGNCRDLTHGDLQSR